jgi:hypothetical protein
MAAIDTKPPKQNLGEHPRAVRKKPQPAALIDDPLLYRDEKTYRHRLWNDFAAFVKSYGGHTISPPDHSPVRVQVPADDTSLENAMASLPRYRTVKLANVSSRLAHGVWQSMRELEIYLWPRG